MPPRILPTCRLADLPIPRRTDPLPRPPTNPEDVEPDRTSSETAAARERPDGGFTLLEALVALALLAWVVLYFL
ncbi:prepilin-type N-terminal cleavage/methylation domain-containing protein, partial [Porticoccus sp.]